MPEDGADMFGLGRMQTPETKEEMQARFQALHHQFVASAKAVALAHEINPKNRVGCMLSAAGVYPYTCSPDDMLEAQWQMKKATGSVGMSASAGAYPYYMERFLKKMLLPLSARQRMLTF